jgi:hypothetical protein
VPLAPPALACVGRTWAEEDAGLSSALLNTHNAVTPNQKEKHGFSLQKSRAGCKEFSRIRLSGFSTAQNDGPTVIPAADILSSQIWYSLFSISNVICRVAKTALVE